VQALADRRWIRRELRAWYVARFPALGRYLAPDASDGFTADDLAWFRSPVREWVQS
jgi:hypothetical protein